MPNITTGALGIRLLAQGGRRQNRLPINPGRFSSRRRRFRFRIDISRQVKKLFVENFNRLLESTRDQLEHISGAIVAFSKSNFTTRLRAGNASGSMGG